MSRSLAILLLLGLSAAPAAAQSYYTVRPDDPKAVYVVRGPGGAVGDGVADDTLAIQGALDTVQASTGEGIVQLPEGIYRLSATLHVWPGIRLIGYGAARPVLALGARTPGYQDPEHPRYLVFFAGARPTDGSAPPDANPGTFYSALSNIDLEIGDGNAGAVGVRAKYAQHCFTSHVEFRIGSGLAGVHEGGNVAEDVRFVGGEYGIWTGTPSPGWQYTLLDARFVGQRRAAIRERAAGLTLIRPHFERVPAAVEIDAGAPDDLWVQDARLEDVSGPAFVISLEENARTQINMARVACRRVPIFARLRESGKTMTGPGETYAVRVFSHGLHYDDLGAPGAIRTVFDASALAAMPPPATSDLAQLPPGDTWVNARTLGARGDGVTDDTAALQAALAAHGALYLPTGKYIVTDTLRLRPDGALIGLHPSTTQLVVPDRTAAFEGVGPPKALLEAPKGGASIVIGIGLYTNAINPRAVAAKWMAGEHSMMNDVRFLGGHGTTGLDGKRERPYNNAHSADPDAARRWDSQYPSLWVTDGGGGTFFALWTPSTFAQAGMLVSHTSTPGRVYQLSSEHHVRHEVQLRDVANWEFHALQTEEERGESGQALPLEIRDSKNLLFTNFHVYRVISSVEPFPWAVSVSGSTGIRFLNFHCYSNSKVAFDAAVYDARTGAELRQREFAWLDVSGRSGAGAPLTGGAGALLEPGQRVERLAGGFHNISGGVATPDGAFYFVDARWQRIYRWSSDRGVSIVADAPLQPVNLGIDRSGALLVVSYAGNGTVYAMPREAANGEITPLAAGAAQARHDATAFLPAGDWRLQRDPVTNALLPRTHQYVSPDGSAFVSATQGFVDGATSWGVKSSDLVRAFGLQPAKAGDRVYLTSEAEVMTWSARVEADGTLTDLRPFVAQGGEGVAVDRDGRVYIAAGDVSVYDATGAWIGTIGVPERPTQLVFGGPDGRTLFMPARHGLYAVRTRDQGR